MVDSYRTEEEQVEALKRWWDENGKSTLVAIVVVVAGMFGWQGWKAHQQTQAEAASDVYQQLLRVRAGEGEAALDGEQAVVLAQQIKSDYSGSSYAQFAALHLAAIAVENDDLAEAEAQLRWVLGKADKYSDIARVAQLRLARVVAARGEVEPALAILNEGGADTYQASYALAKGDILLSAGRRDEARQAYSEAQTLASMTGRPLPTLQAKLQALTPVTPQVGEAAPLAAPVKALEPVVEEEPPVTEEPSQVEADLQSAPEGAQ